MSNLAHLSYTTIKSRGLFARGCAHNSSPEVFRFDDFLSKETQKALETLAREELIVDATGSGGEPISDAEKINEAVQCVFAQYIDLCQGVGDVTTNSERDGGNGEDDGTRRPLLRFTPANTLWLERLYSAFAQQPSAEAIQFISGTGASSGGDSGGGSSLKHEHVVSLSFPALERTLEDFVGFFLEEILRRTYPSFSPSRGAKSDEQQSAGSSEDKRFHVDSRAESVSLQVVAGPQAEGSSSGFCSYLVGAQNELSAAGSGAAEDPLVPCFIVHWRDPQLERAAVLLRSFSRVLSEAVASTFSQSLFRPVYVTTVSHSGYLFSILPLIPLQGTGSSSAPHLESDRLALSMLESHLRPVLFRGTGGLSSLSSWLSSYPALEGHAYLLPTLGKSENRSLWGALASLRAGRTEICRNSFSFGGNVSTGSGKGKEDLGSTVTHDSTKGSLAASFAGRSTTSAGLSISFAAGSSGSTAAGNWPWPASYLNVFSTLDQLFSANDVEGVLEDYVASNTLSHVFHSSGVRIRDLGEVLAVFMEIQALAAEAKPVPRYGFGLSIQRLLVCDGLIRALKRTFRQTVARIMKGASRGTHNGDESSLDASQEGNQKEESSARTQKPVRLNTVALYIVNTLVDWMINDQDHFVSAIGPILKKCFPSFPVEAILQRTGGAGTGGAARRASIATGGTPTTSHRATGSHPLQFLPLGAIIHAFQYNVGASFAAGSDGIGSSRDTATLYSVASSAKFKLPVRTSIVHYLTQEPSNSLGAIEGRAICFQSFAPCRVPAGRSILAPSLAAYWYSRGPKLNPLMEKASRATMIVVEAHIQTLFSPDHQRPAADIRSTFFHHQQQDTAAEAEEDAIVPAAKWTSLCFDAAYHAIFLGHESAKLYLTFASALTTVINEIEEERQFGHDYSPSDLLSILVMVAAASQWGSLLVARDDLPLNVNNALRSTLAQVLSLGPAAVLRLADLPTPATSDRKDSSSSGLENRQRYYAWFHFHLLRVQRILCPSEIDSSTSVAIDRPVDKDALVAAATRRRSAQRRQTVLSKETGQPGRLAAPTSSGGPGHGRSPRESVLSVLPPRSPREGSATPGLDGTRRLTESASSQQMEDVPNPQLSDAAVLSTFNNIAQPRRDEGRADEGSGFLHKLCLPYVEVACAVGLAAVDAKDLVLAEAMVLCSKENSVPAARQVAYSRLLLHKAAQTASVDPFARDMMEATFPSYDPKSETTEAQEEGRELQTEALLVLLPICGYLNPELRSSAAVISDLKLIPGRAKHFTPQDGDLMVATLAVRKRLKQKDVERELQNTAPLVRLWRSISSILCDLKRYRDSYNVISEANEVATIAYGTNSSERALADEHRQKTLEVLSIYCSTVIQRAFRRYRNIQSLAAAMQAAARLKLGNEADAFLSQFFEESYVKAENLYCLYIDENCAAWCRWRTRVDFDIETSLLQEHANRLSLLAQEEHASQYAHGRVRLMQETREVVQLQQLQLEYLMQHEVQERIEVRLEEFSTVALLAKRANYTAMFHRFCRSFTDFAANFAIRQVESCADYLLFTALKHGRILSETSSLVANELKIRKRLYHEEDHHFTLQFAKQRQLLVKEDEKRETVIVAENKAFYYLSRAVRGALSSQSFHEAVESVESEEFEQRLEAMNANNTFWNYLRGQRRLLVTEAKARNNTESEGIALAFALVFTTEMSEREQAYRSLLKLEEIEFSIALTNVTFEVSDRQEMLGEEFSERIQLALQIAQEEESTLRWRLTMVEEPFTRELVGVEALEETHRSRLDDQWSKEVFKIVYHYRGAQIALRSYVDAERNERTILRKSAELILQATVEKHQLGVKGWFEPLREWKKQNLFGKKQAEFFTLHRRQRETKFDQLEALQRQEIERRERFTHCFLATYPSQILFPMVYQLRLTYLEHHLIRAAYQQMFLVQRDALKFLKKCRIQFASLELLAQCEAYSKLLVLAHQLQVAEGEERNVILREYDGRTTELGLLVGDVNETATEEVMARRGVALEESKARYVLMDVEQEGFLEMVQRREILFHEESNRTILAAQDEDGLHRLRVKEAPTDTTVEWLYAATIIADFVGQQTDAKDHGEGGAPKKVSLALKRERDANQQQYQYLCLQPNFPIPLHALSAGAPAKVQYRMPKVTTLDFLFRKVLYLAIPDKQQQIFEWNPTLNKELPFDAPIRGHSSLILECSQLRAAALVVNQVTLPAEMRKHVQSAIFSGDQLKVFSLVDLNSAAGQRMKMQRVEASDRRTYEEWAVVERQEMRARRLLEIRYLALGFHLFDAHARGWSIIREDEVYSRIGMRLMVEEDVPRVAILEEERVAWLGLLSREGQQKPPKDAYALYSLIKGSGPTAPPGPRRGQSVTRGPTAAPDDLETRRQQRFAAALGIEAEPEEELPALRFLLGTLKHDRTTFRSGLNLHTIDSAYFFDLSLLFSEWALNWKADYIAWAKELHTIQMGVWEYQLEHGREIVAVHSAIMKEYLQAAQAWYDECYWAVRRLTLERQEEHTRNIIIESQPNVFNRMKKIFEDDAVIILMLSDIRTMGGIMSSDSKPQAFKKKYTPSLKREKLVIEEPAPIEPLFGGTFEQLCKEHDGNMEAVQSVCLDRTERILHPPEDEELFDEELEGKDTTAEQQADLSRLSRKTERERTRERRRQFAELAVGRAAALYNQPLENPGGIFVPPLQSVSLRPHRLAKERRLATSALDRPLSAYNRAPMDYSTIASPPPSGSKITCPSTHFSTATAIPTQRGSPRLTRLPVPRPQSGNKKGTGITHAAMASAGAVSRKRP